MLLKRRGQIGGGDGEHDAHDGGDAGHPQIMGIGRVGPDVALVHVVGEDGVEGGYVAAMPDINEAISAVSPTPSRPEG